MTDLPRWWDERKDRNRRSRRQEKRIAKESGSRVQAGSGSSWRAPQDIKGDEHLTQVKFTDRASYRLAAAELDAVLRDALQAGRDPRMILEFVSFGLRVTMDIEELDNKTR